MSPAGPARRRRAPIHYVSHGGRFKFDCYREALRLFLAGGQRARARAPRPRAHTDLRRITCDVCWSAIIALGARHA